MRFQLHCRFGGGSCSPGKGSGKGNAGNKAKYTRRNMLAPAPATGDFDRCNEELLARCEDGFGRIHYKAQKSIRQLWEEGSRHLLSLPEHRHGASRYEPRKVGKHGFVSIGKSKCGASPPLPGKAAQAKIYFDKIELYYGHKLLRSCPRSFEKGS